MDKIKDNGLKPILEKLNGKFLEYIGRHGIIPNGKGFINCLHPSHPDRNPSMYVGGRDGYKDEVGYCFSCGKSCNIIHAAHYLEKKPMGGIEFYQDTLPYLCGIFDIPYQPLEISDDQKREYQKRRAYKDAVDVLHGNCFTKCNLNKDDPAIIHLLERGITEETIKAFKIGTIPSFKDYLNEMKIMGWEDRTYLEASDLANKKLFNPGNVLIPINDHRRRIVGFVSRKTNMPANAKGGEKYVNSLNSDIYKKSEILFNFDNFKKEEGPLFIVEGYLDVIYLAQQGLNNVAAIGATVITENHIKLLMDNRAKDIVLCLDADDGGRNGVKLAIDRLAPYKYFNFKIMCLPEGYDPDSFVREFGLEEFLNLAKPDAAMSAFAWTIKYTTFEDDPMVIAERSIPTIAAEESTIVRLKMIRELSRLTAIPEQDIKSDVDSLVNKDSSVYLEELNSLNNFVQVQLSKRKIKDTKSIIQDAMIKLTNLEKLHNNTVDNKSEFNTRLTSMKEKIDGGDFKYGLYSPNFKKFEQMFDGHPFNTCLHLVGGRPSAGKSWKPGTPILMYDGSVKVIENVKIGDLLMGPDSTPRKVMALGTGTENMYDIIPDRGMSWGCNEPHILSLRMSSDNGNVYKKGQIFNLTIKEYLAKNDKFKHHAKLYRFGWELPKKDVPYDPYWIGSWIGNGDFSIPKITTADLKYVEDYYNDFSKRNGFEITKTLQERDTYRLYFRCNAKVHPLRKYLDDNCKLDNEKRIPDVYLRNSTENRLELLAGLIDTDGSLCRANSHTYEITTKYKGLKDDILYLGNSLGFLTTWKIKKVKFNGKDLSYYRIHISGDINRIPVKIERKKATIKSSRTNHLNVGFKIVPTGKGIYHGVTLDKDHLFLLADGTVTHNTSWLTALAINIVESNPDAAIFYMSIDDTTELMSLKMLAIRSGISTSKIKNYVNLSKAEKGKVDEAFTWIEKLSERFIIADAVAGNSVDALESHVEWFTKNFPNKKKIFLLDNFHKLSTQGIKASKTEAVSAMSERIKTITQLNDLHLIATVELRKLEGSSNMPQVGDLKDSVQMEYDADIITLVHNDYQVNDKTNILWTCNDEIDGQSGKLMPVLEISVCKNKVTGIIGKLAYQLNSHNLQIAEIPYGTIRQLRDKKETNGKHQNLHVF